MEYALSNRFYIKESLDVGVTGEGIEDPIIPGYKLCNYSCHIAQKFDQTHLLHF